MLSHQHLTTQHNVAQRGAHGTEYQAGGCCAACVLQGTPVDLADVDVQMQVRMLLATQAHSALSAH